MKKELIERIEVGSGGASSIEFTGIPQDGVDLMLVYSMRSNSTNGGIGIEFNNDSGSNYAGLRLYGQFGGVGSDSYTSYPYWQDTVSDSNDTANLFSSSSFYISNYTSTANKAGSLDSVLSLDGERAQIYATSYATSSPITQVKLMPGNPAAAFAEHSTASLYKVVTE